MGSVLAHGHGAPGRQRGGRAPHRAASRSGPSAPSRALLVAGVTIAWVLGLRAARRLPSRATEAAILASLVAVGLLLVLSPLLSPQYLVWLLPFVAMRWRDVPLVATMAGSARADGLGRLALRAS